MATTEPSPPLAGSAAPPPEQPDEARSSAEPEPGAANPAARPPAPAAPSLGAAAPPASRMSLSALLGSATLGEARPGGRPGPETFRLRFRQFRYQDAAGPREAFRQLRELSRQWLRPDIRTKEQIMEMLVQEQLLAIMPEELRARQRRRVSVRVTG